MKIRQAGIILEMGERVGLRLKLLPHQLIFDTGQHLRSIGLFNILIIVGVRSVPWVAPGQDVCQMNASRTAQTKQSKRDLVI